MSEFFKAPPPPPKPPRPYRRPEWSGPPEGTVPGVVALELVLARSPRAAAYITHLAAYPTGFELDLRATTTPGGEYEFDLEIFGQRWPKVGDKRNELPPKLLRIGLQFADGRTATNIGGTPHVRPDDAPDSPVMLARCGSSGGGASWHQGYRVWPLPPPGELEFVCEWPAAEIPLTRRQIDAQLILDAARRSQLLFPEASTELGDSAP